MYIVSFLYVPELLAAIMPAIVLPHSRRVAPSLHSEDDDDDAPSWVCLRRPYNCFSGKQNLLFDIIPEDK